jgi:MOSC domain-containing protein YiiM
MNTGVESFQGWISRLRSGRTGFYLAVFREGVVTRGDSIEFTRRSDHDVMVADIGALYIHDADNQSLLRRAAELPALPDSW